MVEVVNNQLGERNLEAHHHALLVEILHAIKDAALVGGELHDRADVGRWGDDGGCDPRLTNLVDVVRARQLGGVVDQQLPLLVVEHHLVLAGGGRGDQLQVELALKALLHDLHVQEAEEAAAEAEAEGGRRLRLEGKTGVVEVQLLERFAQRWVILATQRIQAGEDEWQRDLVAREWLGGRTRL